MKRRIHDRRLVAALATLCFLQLLSLPVESAEKESDPRPGLYHSVWPHGRSDAWRTGSARSAGLPAGIRSDSLATKSVELPTAPVWGAVYSGNAIFVLGGSPFLLEQFAYATRADAGKTLAEMTKLKLGAQAVEDASVRPYLAKIDPKTMSVINMVEFPRGTTPNYTSSLLIHKNGRIYTLATSRLYEIDPVTMKVKSLALPKDEKKAVGTIYNTLQVSPKTGDLIIKATNFLDQTLPSRLVSVDTSNLTIRFQSKFPIGATRIALAVEADREYVYASNDRKTLRFVVGKTEFEADEAWSKVYRVPGDGTTPAVSMVYMGRGNKVVFPNNNTVIFGVTQPLKLFMQPTDSTEAAVQSVKVNSASGPGGNFYSAAADPLNTMMVVENDQVNHIIAGWRLTDAGTLDKVWEVDGYRSTGGTAIGSDQKHFYLDDRRCDANGANCELYLVVLDLMTGNKLAEAKVAGSRPTIGQIFLSGDAVFLIATEPGASKGFVTKISAK